MTYTDVCTGVSAATLAWKKLGWKAVAYSEIEPFPSAVLAHHYPETPNLGDMLKLKELPDEQVRADVLVGGTPCQGFSIAGLRGGLEDPRGLLMLEYATLGARFRFPWLVWENVPGVLSSAGGQDFAAFLGLLTGRAIQAPAGGSWPNSGVLGGIDSAYGVAWAILDAQYFGVPQRRHRVFLVGHLGDWRRAAAVLFDAESLRGNPPPSRTPGQNVAGTISVRTEGGGGLGTDLDLAGGLQVAAPVTTKPFADNEAQESKLVVSKALNAKGGAGRMDPTSETMVFDMRGNGDGRTVSTLTGDHADRPTDYTPVIVSHALRGEGFDASEDGTGRGIPLGPAEYWNQTCGCGHSFTGPLSMPCPKCGEIREGVTHGNPIAFDSKASGSRGFADGDMAPTLRSMNGKRQNGGGQVAIAFSEELTPSEKTTGTVTRGGDGGRHAGVWQPALGVRRLIPRECERLQGFPDDYTLVPIKGKPAKDGPRYKAVGNSMAEPCMLYIGQRIEYIQALFSEGI